MNRLLQATREKKVQWSETADEESFRIGLGNGLVRITKGENDAGRSVVTAVLINEAGKTAGEMEQYLGRSASMEVAPNLQELFELARASALDVDGLIGGMLENLSQGKFKKVIDTPKKDDDIPF